VLLKTRFSVQDKGNISDYLGVKVAHQRDGTKTLTQPFLIHSILWDLNLLQKGGLLGGPYQPSPVTVTVHCTQVVFPLGLLFVIFSSPQLILQPTGVLATYKFLRMMDRQLQRVLEIG